MSESKVFIVEVVWGEGDFVVTGERTADWGNMQRLDVWGGCKAFKYLGW